MPPRPNPQAAYYASLGRSTERQANRQRARAATRRNVVTGARPRQAPPTEALRGRAFGSRPARALPRPVRPAAPAPVRQTPAQAAASRRWQYVSEGKAVAKAAQGQRRQTYTERPLGARRQIVAQAHKTAPSRRTAEQRAALQVHHERHAGDVAAVKRIGMTERAAERLGAQKRAEYVSQGQAVERAAGEQGRKATVKVGAFKVPQALTETDPARLKASGFTVDKADKVFQAPLKALSNVPKDVKELAITTPTSLVHMGTRAAGATAESVKTGSPKPLEKAAVQTGKELIEPYKQLVKNPVKFATEHPVSTALMVTPTLKVPGRIGGRALRVAGKQTLERPSATLPGTSLTERRIGSRSAIKRAQQVREDRGQTPLTTRTTARKVKQVVTLSESRARARGEAPAEAPKRAATGPTISQDVLHRRVDEFYDAAGQHKQNATVSALKEAKARHKDLPKSERLARTQEHVEGARAGADQHNDVMFAREFGSHWYRDPDSGAIIKPKNPDEGSGVIHGDRADAEAIAKRVPFTAHVMKLEGKDAWAVVPETAAKRLRHHKKVGTHGATGAVLMRTPSRLFRRTVLPVSPKWLGGQVAEAGVRAAAQGAGPTSYLRGRRLLKAVEAEHGRPEMLRLRGRTTQGGQFGATGPTAEFAKGGIRTLADEFRGTGLEKQAQVLTDIGAKGGLRHLRGGYRAYANAIFDHVNGRIEEAAKTAILGKALKQGPLLERHVGRLSGEAMADAAKGLKSTSSQVELGRAIDRAYGKYSKFGPHAREMIVHSTPFFPWFKNMAKFLVDVMPRDHPVRTAVLADLNAADQEWRIQHRLSYYGQDKVPDWMMGAYPTKGGKNVPVGRFGPFAPGEYVSALGGQVLPQLQGSLLNAAGADWTGKELKNASQENLAANVALTGSEALIPGVGLADRITGLGDRYVRGKTQKPSVAQGKNIGRAALEALNPVKPIGSSDTGGAGGGATSSGTIVRIKPVRVKPVRIKPVRVGP